MTAAAALLARRLAANDARTALRWATLREERLARMYIEQSLDWLAYARRLDSSRRATR